VQVYRTAAFLLLQGLLHDRLQALVALAAQAPLDIGQAFKQAPGEQGKAMFAIAGGELGTQVHYIVAQDAFNPAFQAVFKPDHRGALHTLIQRQRQGAATHRAAFVFNHKTFMALGALLQHVNGQPIFKVDIRRLRRGPLAET